MSKSQPTADDMSVVILCGGQGTRIREASESLPKPLIDIGGKPILWHIMKIYGHYGIRRFVLALGYKGWDIKRFFLDYRKHVSDFSVELSDRHEAIFHNDVADDGVERLLAFCEQIGLDFGDLDVIRPPFRVGIRRRRVHRLPWSESG